MHDNAKKGEQEMAVTMQQIADLAGVSRGTVDRALNDRGRIRPEVAEKIKMIDKGTWISAEYCGKGTIIRQSDPADRSYFAIRRYPDDPDSIRRS